MAMRTRGIYSDRSAQAVCGTLGIVGEAGEFADLIKKKMFHGKQVSQEQTASELGDILWYIALFCDAMGWDMSDIAETNIRKLEARYPNGFSYQAANAPRK